MTEPSTWTGEEAEPPTVRRKRPCIYVCESWSTFYNPAYGDPVGRVTEVGLGSGQRPGLDGYDRGPMVIAALSWHWTVLVVVVVLALLVRLNLTKR